MANYTQIATEVIEDAKTSGNIDASLKKVASNYDLNKHGQQRLVEETNVGLFLDKMQQGTQYEDHELASPIVIDTSDSYGGKQSLVKEASVNDFHIDASMFDLTPVPELEKTAILSGYTSSINTEMMNVEEKWDTIEKINNKKIEDELEKKASLVGINTRDEFKETVIKKLKGDPDLMKSAIAIMGDDNDFIEELLNNSHLKQDEVLQGVITKEAVETVTTLLNDTWSHVLKKEAEKKSSFMGTMGDVDKIGKGLSALVKFPFRNPKTTVGLAGVGYVGRKAIKSNRELEERRKMMHIENQKGEGNE
jgi:hypothetical protein